MKGQKLIQEICANTDLPDKMLSHELKSIISKNNLDVENLTLEQLREILADYLQDVLLQVKKESAV